jgi:SAM-dependent methyltransferase
MNTTIEQLPVPGTDVRWGAVRGHWLLARLGKRVLRPGGAELTRRMLAGLDIGPDDHVVELGPGLGLTAELTLARNPASYTGVERDQDAVRRLQASLAGEGRRFVRALGQETGLPDGSATAVYAEAMVTLETEDGKRRLLAEARRLLVPGGRLGLHELMLVPDDLPEPQKAEIQRQLTRSIRVRTRPLTASEWRQLLDGEGFELKIEEAAPMSLLSPGRFIRDEGVPGTLRFVGNALCHPAALRRLADMRSTFRRHRRHLGAIAIVATRKP